MTEYAKWAFKGEILEIEVTKGSIEIIWADVIVEDLFGDTAHILPYDVNVDREAQLKEYAEAAALEFAAKRGFVR